MAADVVQRESSSIKRYAWTHIILIILVMFLLKLIL